MKVENISRVIRNIAFASLALLGTMACEKEEPTTAKIVVVDEDGKRISDAVVKMFSEPDNSAENRVQRFDFTSTTDASGEVVFDLSDKTMPGQTGFAVLDLTVSASIEGVPYEGIGIVKIIEHESVTEEVILTPGS